MVEKGEVNKKEGIEQAVHKLAESLAEAISSRDPQQVTSLFVDNPYTKYVSDGVVIPYNKLVETLGHFYCELQSLDFHWDKTEVYVLGEDKATLIAYATYFLISIRGESEITRAVYTLVCVKSGEWWGILVAHKSSIK